MNIHIQEMISLTIPSVLSAQRITSFRFIKYFICLKKKIYYSSAVDNLDSDCLTLSREVSAEKIFDISIDICPN